MSENKTPFEEMIDSTMQLAGLVRAYYENLLLSGFTEKQAMILAIKYQEAVLNAARPKSAGE